MTDKLSFSQTFHALENAINITQERNTLISSNISNLDTPKYKAKDIDFKTALTHSMETHSGQYLKQTDPRHIRLKMNPTQSAEIFEENGEWNGYNWVNIDKEMTKLTENNLIYRTAVQALLKKIAIMKEVIK